MANILLFSMCTLSCLYSQSNHHCYLRLSNHRMLVFNVKSGLPSDVVSVKFSSGSAVQRCCFLLNVAQIFTLNWTAVGVFVPPHPPISSLFISDTLWVWQLLMFV